MVLRKAVEDLKVIIAFVGGIIESRDIVDCYRSSGCERFVWVAQGITRGLTNGSEYCLVNDESVILSSDCDAWASVLL